MHVRVWAVIRATASVPTAVLAWAMQGTASAGFDQDQVSTNKPTWLPVSAMYRIVPLTQTPLGHLIVA